MASGDGATSALLLLVADSELTFGECARSLGELAEAHGPRIKDILYWILQVRCESIGGF